MAKEKPVQAQHLPLLQYSLKASEFIEQMQSFPNVYFDSRDGSYYFKPKDEWLTLSTRSLGQHFQTRGLTKMGINELNIRQIDWPIYNAELNNVVSYAGPLGGHKAGLFPDSNGKKWLVTEEAHGGVWADLPKKGEPEFFKTFVQELLPEDQWYYLCYWLAWAYASLRRCDFRLGQAIFLAGPAQCGKSLMQWIITQVLGGRAADPWDYMFGETKFNFSLIKAEHWMIEDPPSATDRETRRLFGERLKMCTNNRDFPAHRKGKDEERVTIFRRVTVSLNDETEHLAVVPPLIEGTKDKIFLFKCADLLKVGCKALDPFIVREEQRELKGIGAEPLVKGQLNEQALQAAIKAELPVLRAWLLRQFSTVPQSLADNRYGIRAWWHPELMAEINALAPEEKLLTFIDQVWWDEECPVPWEGKSTDMDKALRDAHPKECERLLYGANPFGSALKKLIRRYPERISKRVLNGHSIWKILAPLKEQEETQQ